MYECGRYYVSHARHKTSCVIPSDFEFQRLILLKVQEKYLLAEGSIGHRLMAHGIEAQMIMVTIVKWKLLVNEYRTVYIPPTCFFLSLSVCTCIHVWTGGSERECVCMREGGLSMSFCLCR